MILPPPPEKNLDRSQRILVDLYNKNAEGSLVNTRDGRGLFKVFLKNRGRINQESRKNHARINQESRENPQQSIYSEYLSDTRVK